MAILNFHIFNRTGRCVYSLMEPDGPGQTDILYGLLYSLKKFAHRLSPSLRNENNFFQYKTSGYQLVLYESLTSVKFVLLLSPNMSSNARHYKGLLRDFHENIYVEYFAKSPICDIANTTSVIDSQLFHNKVRQYFTNRKLIPTEV